MTILFKRQLKISQISKQKVQQNNWKFQTQLFCKKQLLNLSEFSNICHAMNMVEQLQRWLQKFAVCRDCQNFAACRCCTNSIETSLESILHTSKVDYVFELKFMIIRKQINLRREQMRANGKTVEKLPAASD